VDPIIGLRFFSAVPFKPDGRRSGWTSEIVRPGGKFYTPPGISGNLCALAEFFLGRNQRTAYGHRTMKLDQSGAVSWSLFGCILVLNL
jgi:hypothetical protein